MAYNRDRQAAHEAPEFIEKVVYLNRVAKTVKGGRVMKFSALVVVGDGKGTVGYGLGKAAEVSEAILKGIADAKKNMVKITLDGTTIPHEVTQHPFQVPAVQQPAERGQGLHAGPDEPARPRGRGPHPRQARGRNRRLRRLSPWLI